MKTMKMGGDFTGNITYTFGGKEKPTITGGISAGVHDNMVIMAKEQ